MPAFIDRLRQERGLLTIAEIEDLVARGNVIFDPLSTLISNRIVWGIGNILYPGITLLCSLNTSFEIGDSNVFHATCLLDAATGPITIGTGNQFGEGGFTAKTNQPGAAIQIYDGGRYVGGASVFGVSRLGSGSQILGPITAINVTLEHGGTYREPDADRRAGLLKGTGTARDLTIPMGHAIDGRGAFSMADLKPQSAFHPRT